jgi:hypothetical protein
MRGRCTARAGTRLRFPYTRCSLSSRARCRRVAGGSPRTRRGPVSTSRRGMSTTPSATPASVLTSPEVPVTVYAIGTERIS